MKHILLLARLLRVPHWIKNGFVFAPILFAGKITDLPRLLHVCAGFVSFCFCSSAVYIFNDVRDREEDRAHPLKAKRPVAAGEVAPPRALAVSAAAAFLGTLLGAAAGVSFAVVAILYMVLNVLYSLFFKHVVILDIFIIAAGFLLRVVGGGYAAEVPVSSWILVCTLLLALFLGFSKRRNELTVLGPDPGRHRRILAEYSVEFLDQMIGIVTACTVISYMLYTVSEETVKKFGTRNLIYTSFFVLYGIFRYLYLVYQKGRGGSPTRILLTDVPLMVTVLSWILACIVLIYAP